MAFKLPPPPVGNDVSGPAFRDWFYKIRDYLSTFVGGSSTANNILTEDLTVAADTSYIVTGYLEIGDYTLTLDGNLGII